IIMNRKEVASRIFKCSKEELEVWRKHALFCLKWYQKDNNAFEIEECEFVIREIDKRLLNLKNDN
ncbi:hypothetical protein, partial [Aneurinibacillus migulanus]